MKCDRIQRLISEGYERRLTLEERLDIREHIQTCAACAVFERNLRTGLDTIHRMPDITPSRKLWESVHTLTAAQPRPSPKRVAHQALGIAGAALTVALVAIVTILLINHNGGSTPPSTMTARQGYAPAPSAAAAAPSSTPPTMNTMLAPSGTPETTPGATSTPAPSATSEPSATPTSSGPGIVYVSPTSVVLDHQMAEDTVVGYFHAINLQDYAKAYEYLGETMQQAQSYESFAAGFSETEKDTVTISDISPSSSNPNLLAVTLHLDAEQTDGTTRKYDGTWVVGLVGIDGNVPKIVSASVTEEANATTTPTPVPNNLCRSTQMKVTASYKMVADSIAGSIIVTYGGERSTCVLEGIPQIEVVDANGNVLKTAQVALNPGIVPKPLVLENNQQAVLRFIWSNW
ncbi:MAG TPA: zf-HC2 domain-containing protein, partial [Nitrolancea sp.]